MIKGHVEIELHNHKSGSRERIEKDNLVTNAIQDVTSAWVMGGGGLNGNGTAMLPIATRGLGGLFLFDNVLSNDVSDYIIPDNAKFVGYADRNTDTTNAMRGSFNVLESGYVGGSRNRSYLNVWDFNTSQANGIIKSIALTNVDAGSNPCRVASDIEYGTGISNLIGSDPENNIIFTLSDNVIKKYTYVITEYEIWAGRGAVYNWIEDCANLPSGVQVSRALQDDDYIYFLQYLNSVNKIIKFDKSTYEFSDFITLGSGDNYGAEFVMTPSYLYIKVYATSQTALLKKYSLSSGEFVSEENVSASNFGYLSLGGELLLYVRSEGAYSYTGHIRYPDGTYLHLPGTIPRNTLFKSFNLKKGQIICDSSNSTSRSMLLNYLGTKCNLDEPVEKTSTTTMKVKYTISNV